ncbi:hypothetical protein GGR54DRAFT_634137 [Hypoxylon sp. NC1633]|nr:hypothetical protein GGR54DRAFT_634137 [Hypoxylon sp. NC1633]
MSHEEVIMQHALGQDIRLELEEDKLQNPHYSLSYSLQEARNNNSLNIEASLGLDLQLFSAIGSAKYLNDNKSAMHEARVDVACTIVHRTRRIPQETLAHMTYPNPLDDPWYTRFAHTTYQDPVDNPRYTHFVAEVVEGGSAALTFARPCSSSEEVKNITSEMKVIIVKIPISGSENIEFSEEEKRFFESVSISYSGAGAESVVNLEYALHVAREMPTKLAKQLNPLSYKLLPLSVLDSKANRLIRSLDASLVAETAEALKGGADTILSLKELGEQEMFKKQFPRIHAQILSFCKAFSAAETEFAKAARRLLPELRDGNNNENEKVTELRAAIALFEDRTSIAREYIDAKKTESSVLRTTVAELLAHGFEDHLDGYTSRSMIDGKGPRLLLSFGGSSIGKRKHPLQTALQEWSPAPESDAEEGKEGEEMEDDEEEEWFENPNTVSAVTLGCTQLLRQRSLAIPNVPVIFGVASINKAYRPSKRTKSSTSVGDIILDDKGKLSIVTGKLAKEPTAPKLEVDNQTINVTWLQERTKLDQSVIPTTGFMIKYRRQPNPDKDGAFPHATENEPFTEVLCGTSETSWVLDSLSDDCDYAVAISVQTNVGASDWSPTVVDRTVKLPSVASEMFDFFGSAEVAQRPITNGRFAGQIAFRIVDVAPEFRPDIKEGEVGDHEKTIVAIFTGVSTHGKSTEINAFISYLLGVDLEDPARILVIDDRGAKQHGSVTQTVTCFRIRPLAPVFQGKTLLIVDTPGFGDFRGIERDAFVTAAMSEFFETVNHVNAVIFTVRANEACTTFLSPVSTYVFSLFEKDVRSCLRTAYTFSDAGAPLARGALQALGWPVKNGEISVNNSAFDLELDGSQNDTIVRESWTCSVKGQCNIMHMLLRAAPVPIRDSSKVTRNRIRLEARCELAEKNILRIANEAQTLIAKLNALAETIGKTSDQMVPVHDGHATTLCLDCNVTCHGVCVYAADVEKEKCIAMTDGCCTVCEKKCKWYRHRNVKYTIVTGKQEQWVVPMQLFKTWDKANNSLEGALLGAMDTYLKLQEKLREEIMKLAELREGLTKTVLLHDPSGLHNCLVTLYKTIKAQGVSTEHLDQLVTAINTLIRMHVFNDKGKELSRDSNTLLNVIGTVREEMERRMKLSELERIIEGMEPSNLYYGLWKQLPAKVKKQALSLPLTMGKLSSPDDPYPYSENLKAVIGLIQLVLMDEGVIAALASGKEK